MKGKQLIYLDNSATTKLHPQVVSAMMQVLTEDFGNPSSLYKLGLEAEKKIKTARAQVAKTMGVLPEEIYFTGCGTESDNTAIKGIWEARKKQGKRIITTAVEHPAVLQCCKWLQSQGADVVYLPVNSEGLIEIEDLKKALTSDTILVSIMYVNNETGAIMPLKKVRKALDDAQSAAVFHTDAIQAWGKEPLNAKELGVDMISVSGHKIHGPKGIGALYVRKGLHCPVFMHGGGQENGFRSGTENVAGIVGLGIAAELITLDGQERYIRMAAARDYLKDRIAAEIPQVTFNGPEDGCPSLLNVSFIGCRAEVLLHTLDSSGICVSTGSACSSHSKGSHVLSAMGLRPEQIDGAVRFSFCAENTVDEMDCVMECLKAAVESQRKLRAAFKRK
ncbi:MAG: cysteine desulfurase [Firmicutes bacterium]|nr:cysteine desulfurase [Bacillota bacterium]